MAPTQRLSYVKMEEIHLSQPVRVTVDQVTSQKFPLYGPLQLIRESGKSGEREMGL